MRISTEYNPAEVELWGHEFETIEVTKSLRKKLAPFQEKIDLAVDDEDVIQAVGFVLDGRLKATDGKRKKPSTLLNEQWDKDKISVARAMGILSSIGRADLPS